MTHKYNTTVLLLLSLPRSCVPVGGKKDLSRCSPVNRLLKELLYLLIGALLERKIKHTIKESEYGGLRAGWLQCCKEGRVMF